MNTMLISPTHGDFVFDAVFRTDHTLELEVTQHPVQKGTSITDHSFFQPEEISFTFGYSDVMAETGEVNHSVNAYAHLREIMTEREPVVLVTRLWRYENMLITQLSAPDEVGQMFGLRGELRLRKIIVVEASIVKVKTKITSSKGTTTAKPLNEESLDPIELVSVIRRGTDAVGVHTTFEGADGKASTEWVGPVVNKGATVKGK